MDKRLIYIVLTIFTILLCIPVVSDITQKINEKKLYGIVNEINLKANIKNIENKDYKLYVDFKEDNEFSSYYITSGDLKIEDNQITFALYSKYLNKCVFKLKDSEDLTMIDTDEEACKLNKIYKDKINSVYKIDKNTQTITYYYGPEEVNIPETIDGVEVLKIGKEVFKNKNITSVYIPDNIKVIEEEAFMNNNITKLEIKGEVIIEDRAFMNNLIEEININKAIYGVDCFKNNLIDKYFINDDILMSYGGNKDITIPDNVKEIKATFDNAKGIFNTGNGLINIPDNLFKNQKLEEVIIGNNVKTIGSNAFYNNNIKKLTINSVQIIKDKAFENNLIEEIIFPNNLTKIEDNAFYNNNLYNITFNSNLDYIGNNSFMNNLLTTLKLNVNKIGEESFKNNLLEDIDINCNNYGVDSFKNNLLEGKDAYIIENNTLISYGGKNKKDVKIPDNVIRIRATFENMEGIFDVNNVTIVPDYLLYNNKVDKIIINDVIQIGTKAFANNNIQEVIIPSVTVIIEDSAFIGNKIKKIIVLGKTSEQDFEKLGINWNNNIEVIFETLKNIL